MARRGFAPIILLIILALLGIVGYAILNNRTLTTTVSTPYDKVFQSNPQPITIKPVKSETSKREVLTEKGGALELKDGQKEVSLSLPENALLSPEEIGINTLTSVQDLPEGSKFIAGAELTPDGLGFINNSLLKFKLPKGTSTENLAAFSYDADGQGFHYTPFTLNGDVVEISINGFSGGGIIDIPGLIPVINPGTDEKTAKQLLADVVRRAKGKMTPELLQEARGILNAWYYQSVKPDLKLAETDDSMVDGAIKHMLSWRAQVNVFVLDNNFQKEFEESLNSSAKGVKHGVYQSDKRCVNQKDPRQVSALLRWLKLSQLLGLDGRGGLKDKDIEKKAKNCLVFEVKMNSTITVPSLTMVATANLNGVMQLNDDFTHFEGGGQVHEDGLTYSTGAGTCRTTPVTYDFSIKDTLFNINFNDKSSGNVNLIFDLGTGDQRATLTCPLTSISIEAPWSAIGGFYPGFPPFHKDELVEGNNNTYLLKDWELIGSKDVYARKVYRRTIGGSTEDTTFTLRHTPRK